jgi:hypothetical protein
MKNNQKIIIDFILGGLIIAIPNMYVRNNDTAIGGFLLGAVPASFIYIYLYTLYYHNSLIKCRILSKSVFISSCFFSVCIWFVYLFNYYGKYRIQVLVYSIMLTLLLCLVFFRFYEFRRISK